jgi:beta-glucanase (GH16 family)
MLLFTTPSLHAGWQLAWSDEFNGASIATTNWTFEIGNGSGGWGNNEREYYTARTNNAYVANGLLHIVARLETTNGFPYTSARMKSQGLFSHKYGRFEFRAALPQGVGCWPALWMMGTNITSVGWPACGEMDVMENNGSWSNQVQGTIHYSDTNNNHLQQTKLYSLPSGGLVTNFHTYAVQWTSNSIQWLVDSNLVQTWTTWSSYTNPYPAPFNQPFFILMNLAIGGNYLGNPSDAAITNGTPFPVAMLVDYVRVYDFVASAPDQPTGLGASEGNGKTYLNWDASTSGASGYNVKRATNSGGPYTTISSAATNGFVDSTVSSCANYFYVVSATNSVGESANSSGAAAALGAFAFAVNSGGSAADQFVADTGFTGGTQSTPGTATVDTSAVVLPAPQAVYQTERYGNFTYTNSGLTAGLSYKVRLHFAEIYWTSAGQRRFNVSINGTQVLTNFDIIAAAGAANKANIQEFWTTANGSGQIVIQYTTVTDNAKSSGIEILIPQPAAPASVVVTAGDTQVVLNWASTIGAGSYNVKRSLLNGGPYSVLSGGLTGTNYTDSIVTNGTTYYYVVSAVSAGCESTNSTQASATPVCSPPPSPSAGNDGPICSGSILSLIATTVPGATYTWTGPNTFSSSSQNPSITNATTNASGIYSVRAIVGSCTSVVATTTAAVNQLPTTPAAGNNGPIWAGMTLNLTASAVSGAVYNWTGPGGFTSTNQNPSIPAATTNASGIYSVTVTSGGCVSPAATTAVTVNPPLVISLYSYSNGLAITWPAGTLQMATNLLGPWNDLLTATNPYFVLPDQPQQFYRAKLPQ